MKLYVKNLNDSGIDSLRAAICRANQSQDTASSIYFNVSGTITLLSSLPKITKQVTINGLSAPNYKDRPVIEINCNGNEGLIFKGEAAGSELLGLSITNSRCSGVEFFTDNIVLHKNFIGINLLGLAAGNKQHGVYIKSNFNKIGLPSDNFSNVISGNCKAGIYLQDCKTNVLVNNRIGTDPIGLLSIRNGDNGIVLNNSSNNTIGGTIYTDANGNTNNPTGTKGTVQAVFVVPPLGNLISGNGQNGVLLVNSSQNNSFYGNFIGTTADGDNSIPNKLNGVLLDSSDNNSFIGCTFVDQPFVYYNVMSGNGANGMKILDSNNITVQGNFFGIGASSLVANPNEENGLLVAGKSSNITVGGVIPLGNVCSGNKANGIHVADQVSYFTSFNTFGGLAPFGSGVPNQKNGILITSAKGNNTLRTNVFSGNLRNGIHIAKNATDVTIDSNIVGLSTSGKYPLVNGKYGILFSDNANNNKVLSNDVSVIPITSVSSNVKSGIKITDHAHHNTIMGINLGLDISLLRQLKNNIFSVEFSGHCHDNTLSQSYVSGDIFLGKSVFGNSIIGNYIGLNRFLIKFPDDTTTIINKSEHDNIIKDNHF